MNYKRNSKRVIFFLRILVLASLSLFTISTYGQARSGFYLQFEGAGFVNGNDALPFWLRSNNYGRVGRNTDGYGIIAPSYKWQLSENSSLAFKSALAYRNEFNEVGDADDLFMDELYAELNTEYINAFIGVKHGDIKYNGLASSNQSILWSDNARSFPGLEISTAKPIYFLFDKRLGFEALFSEYLLNDNRSTEDTHVHHKYLALVYKFNPESILKLGVRHVAQYGGNPSDPRFEDQSINFSEYVRMFFGREGGDNAIRGDQINAVGNHIGSYELSYNKKYGDAEFELFYNSIFDDGSGSAMKNFPDGRYGVFYDSGNKENFINSFVYEFIYTKNQSQTAPHLWDNYFNNGVYSSGWTYQQNVIGIPFITSTYLSDYGNGYITVGNNRLLAHHLGVEGKLFFPYTLKLSYRRNYGINRNRGSENYIHYESNDERSLFKVAPEVVSSYLEVGLFKSFMDLDLLFAADFATNNSNFAAGLSVSKSFF